MQKVLTDTADGCALLEYLVEKMGSDKNLFTPAFCDEHVTEYRRRWLAAGMDDACVGSLYPATIFRHAKPLFSNRSKTRVRNWSRVFARARDPWPDPNPI